jgi:lipoprotein-anchoring transpeptidase ErfK/SrfK
VRPAHFIVVDKSQYRLYYHEHGHIVRVFDCVLGKPSTPTPAGRFRIYAKDSNVYGAYGARRMRYLGFFAIHGTNEPWLLTRFPRGYSHGCTRLSNTNILWLYARCPVGTQVWNVP